MSQETNLEELIDRVLLDALFDEWMNYSYWNASLSGTSITVTDKWGNAVTTDLKGEKGDAFTYGDFTAAQIAALRKPADDAAADALAVKQSVQQWYDTTSSAWDSWYGTSDATGVRGTWGTWYAACQQTWTGWESAEQGRVTAESGRVTAENGRVSAESGRVTAESTRESNEGTRKENETAREQQASQDHTTAGNDHTQAGTDHTQAGNDHTRAETDHNTASSDHTQAGDDHSRAETDHTTADSDHTTAGEDHTQAGNDHTQADNDHTRADTDHTTADNDHTQAGTDHSTAASDHTQAGTDHTESVTQSAYAKNQGDYANEQGDYAKNIGEHPSYIADGTAAKPGDANYWYIWDYDAQSYVKDAYAKGDDLHYSEMSQQEKEDLAGNVLAAISFDATPTAGSNNAVTSQGIKTYVDNLTATATAEFKGTFLSQGDMEAVTADRNDYCYLVSTDEDGNTVYNRYKWKEAENAAPAHWVFEYALNSNSFTADEWTAIQSGITADLVAKLSALPSNAELTSALDEKQDTLTFASQETCVSLIAELT